MKKQILTLAMCLAVSATAVSAESAKSVKPTNQKSEVAMEKPVEPQKFKSEEEAKKFFECKMAQRREAFYKELGLTPEQKAKADALDAKTKADAQALHKKFKEERKKLMESSKKSFEDILTKEQKAKLKEIDKETKEKMEKMRKERKDGEFIMAPPKGSKPCPTGIEPMGHPKD